MGELAAEDERRERAFLQRERPQVTRFLWERQRGQSEASYASADREDATANGQLGDASPETRLQRELGTREGNYLHLAELLAVAERLQQGLEHDIVGSERFSGERHLLGSLDCGEEREVDVAETRQLGKHVVQVRLLDQLVTRQRRAAHAVETRTLYERDAVDGSLEMASDFCHSGA